MSPAWWCRRTRPNKEGAFEYLNAMLDLRRSAASPSKMGYLPTVDERPLTGKVAEQLALPDPPPKLVEPDYAVHHQDRSRRCGLVEEDDPAQLTPSTAATGHGGGDAFLGPATLRGAADAGRAAAAAGALQPEPLRPDRADDRGADAGELLRFFTDPFYVGVMRTTIARRGRWHRALPAVRPADGLVAWRAPQPLEIGADAGGHAAAVHRQHRAHGRLDDPVRPAAA